jgi:hypothetical protein
MAGMSCTTLELRPWPRHAWFGWRPILHFTLLIFSLGSAPSAAIAAALPGAAHFCALKSAFGRALVGSVVDTF